MSQRILPDQPLPRKFGALRDKPARRYLFRGGLSMLGDNNEHVLTYWVLWQHFHSPALVGFQVISHWLPYLLFSVPFGALAERFDCRRLIQAAQVLFMLVSVSWGILFMTGTLQLWVVCVLLILHGCAGALWAPAEQLLLQDFSPPSELPSAIRLNAMFRNLGTLAGPIIGSALLFGLGPTWGIFVNVLFYLPMTVLMIRTPFDGHVRSGYVHRARVTFRDTFGVIREVRGDRVMAGMLVLAALIGLCLGGSLQAAIPAFADGLGAAVGGVGYAALLLANGVGGVVGGLLLEAAGILRPSVGAAVVSTVVLGATTVSVALTSRYAIAISALIIGGVASLVSQSVTQAVVQLRAPVTQRGRIVGLFNMVGQGLRTGNGIMLAVVGSLLGVSAAIAIGGATLAVGAIIVGALIAPRAGTRIT